jgi:hypothetical protein
MVARLLNKFHALWDQYVLCVPPRAANPYLTHIPILLAAARWQPLATILEFGCGDISTRTFLDHRFFPQLQRLESYENDTGWAERLRQQVGADPRLNLHFVPGSVASVVGAIDLEQFDLIFIDDSTTADARSATIRAVSTKRPRRPVVVVHDFELLTYRVATRAFRHRYRFTGLNPNTGVLWNEAALCKNQLRALDRLLRSAGEKPDAAEWSNTLAMAGHSSSSGFLFSKSLAKR